MPCRMYFDADVVAQRGKMVVAPMGLVSCDAVFDFYGSALSFPPYFGRNWDAFRDCIHDLSWLEGEAVHIVHKELPLGGDLHQQEIFLSILYDSQFYSRINGKFRVHFPPSDRQEALRILCDHYCKMDVAPRNEHLERARRMYGRGEGIEDCLREIDMALNDLFKDY